MKPTTTKAYSLQSRPRVFNLKQQLNQMPPTDTRPSHPKGAPPVPNRFEIVKSPGEGAEWSLDLGDDTLAQLAFEKLDLRHSDASRDGGCFVGPRAELQQVQEFARLFTSMRMPASVDSSDDIGEICGYLVMSGQLKLSRDNFVSGSANFISGLALELSNLAQKSPEAAFALFCRCSQHTQVAILADHGGAGFLQAIEGDGMLKNRCTKILAAAAYSAASRGERQLLKRILIVYPIFARAHVLEMLVSRCARRVAQLCSADSELTRLLLERLPADDNCRPDVAQLRSLLAALPQRPLPRPNGSEPLPRDADVQGHERLRHGGWLTVTPSGELHLDNVPSKEDVPVEDVIELLISVSPDSALLLAQDFFAGFRGLVKRSADGHWTTPSAMQAWCALQKHVDQLVEAGDPNAPFAQEVVDKFRKRLATAWAGLDVETRTRLFSGLLVVLDGSELAACRNLLPPPCSEIDLELYNWISFCVANAGFAESYGAVRTALRRCGVLCIALKGPANFIPQMLTWLVAQSGMTRNVLGAFLAMLEEADPEVYKPLALANAMAPKEPEGSLIVRIHADNRWDLVPGQSAGEIRSLMRDPRWDMDLASPLARDVDAAALQRAQATTSIRQALLRMTPSVHGADPLQVGATRLAGAMPGSKQADTYLHEMAKALVAAPSDYSPSSQVRDALTKYVLALVETSDWKALTDCCQTLRPGFEGNASGQIFLAELLGKFATSAWNNEKPLEHVRSVRIVASFLNSGPFSPNVMEKFTHFSQDILASLHCATLWKEDNDGLFTAAGKEARYAWVRTALGWIASTDNRRIIAMASILGKCPEPPPGNKL